MSLMCTKGPVDCGTRRLVNKHGVGIAQVLSDGGKSEEEVAANCALIVQAFNVATETGLTPAELWGQYQRAVEMLGLAQMAGARGLPDTLDGHWNTGEGREMAKEYLERYPTRERLAHGRFTDMEVAHQIAMTGRGDLAFEGKLTMAKDRIRWLSAQLARRLGELEVFADMQMRQRVLANKVERENRELRAQSDLLRRAVEAAAVFQAGGPLAYLMRLGDSTVVDGPPAAAKRIAELEAALTWAAGMAEEAIEGRKVSDDPEDKEMLDYHQDELTKTRALLAAGVKP